MNKYIKFFGTLLIIFFALVAISTRNVVATDITTGDANTFSCAENLVNTYSNYLSWFNAHCITPTPSPVCSPTPTPIQEVTPTPTPTQTPSDNNGGGNSGGGSNNPASCGDQKPNQPYNLLVVAGPGGGQATLTWGPPSGPVTDYSITYSDDPNTQKWGVVSTGNATTYTISGLSVNKYYFWVRAVNGCMPGDPIGPATVGGTGGPEVLGASTGPQVLGLSTTSGEESALPQILQIFGVLTSVGLGFVFLKKNA